MGYHLMVSLILISLTIFPLSLCDASIQSKWDKTASKSLEFIIHNIITKTSAYKYLLWIHSFGKYDENENMETEVVKLIYADYSSHAKAGEVGWRELRFLVPICIFLGPLDSSSIQYARSHLGYYLIQPFHLFRFSYRGQKLNPRKLQSYEAFSSSKIVFKVSSAKLKVALINKDNHLETSALDLLSSPLEFHKATSWYGNAEKVPALVHFGFINFIEKYGKDVFRCLDLLKRRSNYLGDCNQELFQVAYLAQTHNLTLDVYVSALDYSVFPFDKQHIYTALTPKTNFIWNYYLSTKFHHENAIYCEGLKSNANYLLKILAWIQPLTLKVWMCTILCYFCIHQLLRKRSDSAFIVYWAIVLNQSAKYSLSGSGRPAAALLGGCTLLFSLFIGIFYGNGLTSLVTVADKTQTFQSLREMLEAGYKILEFPKGHGSQEDPTQRYGRHFKVKGMEHLLNSSFHVLHGELFVVDKHKHWFYSSWSRILNSHIAQFFAKHITNVLNQNRTSSLRRQCHVIPEYINPGLIFWKFKTLNRFWLMKTLRRMNEGALFVPK